MSPTFSETLHLKPKRVIIAVLLFILGLSPAYSAAIPSGGNPVTLSPGILFGTSPFYPNGATVVASNSTAFSQTSQDPVPPPSPEPFGPPYPEWSCHPYGGGSDGYFVTVCFLSQTIRVPHCQIYEFLSKGAAAGECQPIPGGAAANVTFAGTVRTFVVRNNQTQNLDFYFEIQNTGNTDIIRFELSKFMAQFGDTAGTYEIVYSQNGVGQGGGTKTPTWVSRSGLQSSFGGVTIDFTSSPGGIWGDTNNLQPNLTSKMIVVRTTAKTFGTGTARVSGNGPNGYSFAGVSTLGPTDVTIRPDINSDFLIDSTPASADITSPQNPFRFWTNDDYDSGGHPEGEDKWRLEK